MTQRPRILIVDDEQTVCDLLTLSFAGKPWEVSAVGTAEEALQLCREGRVDFLVLDKNLPGMSGVELLRELRKDDDAIGCLMMTAYGSAESALEMLSLGVDGYIEKPFDNVHDVAERVERGLGHRRGRRSKMLAQARDHFRAAQAALSAQGAEVSLAVVVACVDGDREFVTAQLPNDLLQFVETREQLIERLRKGGLDLVIADIDLAEQSVTAFARQLRQAGVDAAFVFLCDQLELPTITQLIDIGVDALVTRPLRPGGFHVATSRLLTGLRQSGEDDAAG